MKKAGVLFLSVFTLVLFTGCEDKEDANLFKAQLCLDQATSATANSCLSSISTNFSKQAYVLRCSAAFISEDITEVKIAEALKDIEKKDTAKDPTVTTISALRMDDTAKSQNALNVCEQSEAEALIALASFSNISTIMSTALGGGDIQSAIDSYNDGDISGAEAESLAQAVIASQGSLCDPKTGLMKGTEACDNINQAVTDGATDQELVDALLANLKDANN